MPAIILSDNGATSGSAGLKTSGGNDGVLQLQTTTSGGTPTTAISISNTQVVTYTNQPTYTGGTANGVLYLNGSKAVTSGTALSFDGTAFASTGSGTQSLTVTSTATAAYVQTTGANTVNARLQSNSSNASVGTLTNHNFLVQTNASSVATFDTSGNLGLGVTPSAWGLSGTLAAIQIKNSSIAGQSNNAYWGANWFGGGFDKYIANGYASLAVQTAGGHTWYTAPSGTAGNAITFTQAMTLDVSGNLGLRATPSSWSSATPALQIGAFGVVTAHTSANYCNIGTNYYFNGSNNVYIGTGAATLYSQNAGAHAWYVAGSGTAGNTVSFSQSMTLSSSGHLGVGVTSPSNFLHVRASTPTGGTSSPAGTVIQVDSNSNNYVGFVNTADNGTYAGLTFTDNNTGGFVVFRNYTAGGVSVGSDCMIYGAYNDHIWQNGTSDTINGKTERARLAQDGTFTLQNRLVTNSTSTAITLNSGGDLRIYSASNSYNCDIYCDPPQSGMAATGYIWIPYLMNASQRTSYDRQWNNEPSITVLNDTSLGSQANYRIHGAPGASGGDFSVNLIVDGTVTGLSDARVKTEINPIQNALATVCQLEGKTFKFVNSALEVQTHTSMAGGRKFGFIAQQIKDIIPETVIQSSGPDIVENENGVCKEFSVDYASVVALLTEAIKELKAEIDVLKGQA